MVSLLIIARSPQSIFGIVHLKGAVHQRGLSNMGESILIAGFLETLVAMVPLSQVKLCHNARYPGDLCCLVVVDYINPSRREVAGRLLSSEFRADLVR